MKKIAFFFLTIIFTQKIQAQMTYEQLWQQATSAEQKELPETTQEIVEQIYKKAKNEKNAPNLVKAIIYKLKYYNTKHENDLVKAIERLSKEIESNSFPVNNLLYSMRAEILWNYYEQNRWKFAQRTTTAKKNEDISTWSIAQIIEEIRKCYKSSLDNPTELQKIPINLYDEILQKGMPAARVLRPTLYDFLAWRAVNFFQNHEANLTQPFYYFQLDKPELFAPTPQFIQIQLQTQDIDSFKFIALQLYQNLLKINQNSSQTILLHIDLSRLKFVHSYSVLYNKDTLYLQALQKVKELYQQSGEELAFVYYEEALYHYNKGNYLSHRLPNPKSWKKAYEICQEAIRKFPKSKLLDNFRSLQKNILAKYLLIEIEKFEPSHTPFKALLTFANIENLYYRIIKISPEEVKQKRQEQQREILGTSYQESEKKFIKHFLKKPLLKSSFFKLPNLQDFQRHTTEIPFEGLPIGTYMIVISENPDFSTENNSIAYQFITITDIAFIKRNSTSNSTEIYTLHRKTGEPLAGVEVEVWLTPNWNSRTLAGKFKTDEKGYLAFPKLLFTKDTPQRNFDLVFRINGDFLSTENWYATHNYGGSLYQEIREFYPQKNIRNSYFFLDRAIYRPGQTIFFKGLLFEKNGKEYKILPNETVEVGLYNSYAQLIETKTFTTNEYGTFNGFFIAPQKGLTGTMHLQIEGHSPYYFLVEEYKRPKFEVLFKPSNQTYQLEDEVSIEGKAESYSGSAISQAKVSYRVMRKTELPIWHYHSRYTPNSTQIEIANGFTTTDETGKFKITFKAIPDLSINKADMPIFNYYIYADVTDLNGETQSNQTIYKIGYHSLQLKLNLPEKINQDTWQNKPIPILTTNLMEEFTPAKGKIHIYKLISPNKPFKKRLWNKPELHIISKNDFAKLFPHEAYQNEDEIPFWQKEKEVFSTEFDTNLQKELTLNTLAKWQTGMYAVEITATDKYGKTVQHKQYFEIFSKKEPQTAIPRHLSLFTIGNSFEVGQKIPLLLASFYEQSVYWEISQNKEIFQQQWLHLTKNGSLQNIIATNAMKGGIYALAFCIRNNRFYHEEIFINIPYEEKELEVTFESYRNKIQPGEQEEWRLRIKGKKADKIAAEMVATLYDASLDAFRENRWEVNFWKQPKSFWNWEILFSFAWHSFNTQHFIPKKPPLTIFEYRYDKLNWFGLQYNSFNEFVMYKTNLQELNLTQVSNEEKVYNDFEAPDFSNNLNLPTLNTRKPTAQPHIRKNFNETAFFYPELRTNENGEIIIKFTVPDALTRWKMLGFVHTKDLAYALTENTLVTQKELMVVPNPPRFYRENDEMNFAVKVTSLTNKELTGSIRLEFFDATSEKKLPINLSAENQTFTLPPQQSKSIEWKVRIPEDVQAITYRVIAQADRFSDGEEQTLPVLSHRMLVTETMPIAIRGKQKKSFVFEKLLQSQSSKTLKHQNLILEFTSNPAWYAVQALPYMMEYPYECTEQLFSRYYANAIATHIANSYPAIKQAFDSWRQHHPDALLSNLEKNQELKSAILEETPWLLEAQNETQRKKQIALLFDLNRMINEQNTILEKIRKNQLPNGAFAWFAGLPEDRYITQHIVAQMGHLKAMQIAHQNEITWQMIQKAIEYIDRKIVQEYIELKNCVKQKQCKLEDNHLKHLQIHYLYARSYFRDISMQKDVQEAVQYYLQQAKTFWTSYPLYTQGMLCLALHRWGDSQTPFAMIKSFSEKALHSEELGMYWKYEPSWWWYHAPIETQALMIEVYDEVARDTKTVEELKIWLLKQKQTQNWKTTRATAEACYALLRRGENLLADTQLVDIRLGNQNINAENIKDKLQTGTGYFKTNWHAEQIHSEMANVKVHKKDNGIAWGAIYWQYFENLDKITFAQTPISIKKELFLEKDSDKGKILVPIDENNPIRVGNIVKVRIEIRVDRDMEYVHLKDMRAAGFEPINVLSGHRYQDGLWYYESPRDMSTNFFISYLPKGTYVFEYPLRANIKGSFSKGIASIQCMYAPEFTSHSSGVRIKIE